MIDELDRGMTEDGTISIKTPDVWGQDRLAKFASMEDYNAAIRLDPANPETATAYFNVGAIMEERGRLSEASEAYRNAVRLDPSSALYQRRLNDVLKKQS